MRQRMNIAIVITIGLLIPVGTPAQADEVRERGVAQPAISQLRGAWKATLTPGEGGPPPFDMLLLFTRDGGVMQTDAGLPNPLLFSPGFGDWTRTGERTFSIGYAQLEFDAGGAHVGFFRGLLNVTLDEATNTFTGTARVRFYDAAGEILFFEAEGTVGGKRLAIE